MRFDKVIAKIEWCNFCHHSVQINMHHLRGNTMQYRQAVRRIPSAIFTKFCVVERFLGPFF